MVYNFFHYEATLRFIVSINFFSVLLNIGERYCILSKSPTGLRVLDDVKYLLELDYKGKFLAPKDGRHDNYNLFKCHLSYDNSDMIEKVKRDLGENILNDNYFLNSIWIYDTNILRLCDKKQMIEAMNTYTLCRTNEMGIMNLLLRFKYNLWEPFPFKISSGKILFDWCELNNPNTNWKDYCYIKYPVTISFDDC
jgi:hypothetical protein